MKGLMRPTLIQCKAGGCAAAGGLSLVTLGLLSGVHIDCRQDPGGRDPQDLHPDVGRVQKECQVQDAGSGEMFCSSLSSRRHLTNSNKTNRDNSTRVFLLYIFSLSDIKCSIIIQQVYMYFHQNYKRCIFCWRNAKTAKTNHMLLRLSISLFTVQSSSWLLGLMISSTKL